MKEFVMRKFVLLGFVWWLSGNAQAADAVVDLTQIDRRIAKEPVYRSKSPKYCLLVFGPQAGARVWLVVDGDALYVDRDGDGDLTGKNERVPWTESANAFVVNDLHVRASGVVFRYPRLLVRKWAKQPCEVELNADLWSQLAGGECGLKFAERPAHAPIIHFDGPWTMDDSRRALGAKGAQTLVRGEQTKFRLCIGTPGLGAGAFAFLCHERYCGPNPLSAKTESLVKDMFIGIYPIAEIEFPADKTGVKSIRKKVVMKKRCCGCWFYDDIAAPARVGKGVAKVTLSCPGWKRGKIAPATFEIPVVDAED